MIKARCPICGRKMEGQTTVGWPQFPFCSTRCKTIDLGRWLSEDYRIPAGDEEEHPNDSAETETP